MKPTPALTQPKPEREITETVDICLPNGRLNPSAVGWTRQALHRDNLRGWGRNKRFDYWCIMCDDFIVTANISHHDYRANVASTFVDLATNKVISQRINRWFPSGRSLPDPTRREPMLGRATGINVDIIPVREGTRLTVKSERLQLDAVVMEPETHESMGVLVPWNDRCFQYTRKDNCLRTEGAVVVDGVRHAIDPDRCLALHDVGRGRWPYSTWWNWSAGHGLVGDRLIGVQFGGKWTEDTPSTENCLRIDGRVHKISEELHWDYDTANFMKPWTITGARVALEFKPTVHHHHNFDRWIVSARGDQCFGHFSGQITADDGEVIEITGLPGMAEEVYRKW